MQFVYSITQKRNVFERREFFQVFLLNFSAINLVVFCGIAFYETIVKKGNV